MNLYDLLQDNKSLNITINRGYRLLYCTDEEAIVADKLETYLGAKQVCEILNINDTTLWRWENKGYLISSNVGGKRRFKCSEVKNILDGGLKK